MTVDIFSPTADGVLAAILAPFFMALGFFIWDCRWTTSGASSFALNMYKCNVASFGFIIMCLVRGFAISGETSVFTISSVGFLILSSTLGIIIGDILWIEAMRLLGAKDVIVIDSLKPFVAAFLGWVFLDEVLLPPAWGGVVLTVIGVGVVQLEEKKTPKLDDEDAEKDGHIARTDGTERIGFNNDEEEDVHVPQSGDTTHQMPSRQSWRDPHFTSIRVMKARSNSLLEGMSTETKRRYRGYACAIFNMLFDSVGSLLTRVHGVGMTTWSINLIRFGFAGVVCICISSWMRFWRRYSKSREPIEAKSEVVEVDAVAREEPASPPQWFEFPTLTRIGWLQITVGVAFVTFLCPALSNYALFQIALALAISLGSIGPLYALFLDWPFKGKRPTLCASFGVLLAIAGVVILSVWDTPVGNSLWLLIALLVHAQHGSILDDTDRARAQISMRETEGMLTGGFLH